MRLSTARIRMSWIGETLTFSPDWKVIVGVCIENALYNRIV